jgi:uncharacterized LabA/DUF88 family protein
MVKAKTNGTAADSGRHKNLLFQKVAIFVDAENIETSGLKHHEGRTDYKKILEKVGDREIIRIMYYKPEYKEISKEFEAFWAGLGGEIRRPTKNADTFLVIDAVTMAEKIDVAIILGGDKDFLPLIWYLRSRGCRVEIWSWPETTSLEMQKGSDLFVPLTEEFVMRAGERNSAERGESRTPQVASAPPTQAMVREPEATRAPQQRPQNSQRPAGGGQSRSNQRPQGQQRQSAPRPEANGNRRPPPKR